MSDGQVVFEITADGKHAIASIKDVTEAIQRESKKWDQSVDESADNMTKAMTKALDINRLKDWGLKAAKVLADFGWEAIQAASDLQEVQNVVDTTFGSNASKIEKWAKTAGTQFGLTETQAKKFTSTLGAMMKSAGMSGDEIVDMSTDLAGLAADMASFYNLDFETAFQKIRSGISGETEPLKQLGVNMSVANLEAFALQKGLTKTFASMSQGEQTMLRYQYLMQATADAQGDFAKTSDSFANAQRRVETAVETIKTTLGSAFLGIVGNATSALANFLEQVTKQPERTVLDDFNDIEVDTASKMKDLNETYNKAQDIIKVLDEISKETVTLNNGSSITFEELFKNIADVEKNGGSVNEYLQSLGVDVDYVTMRYQEWKEATKQLVKAVPELSEKINEQTGEIDGGTEALQKNLDEWKAYQEKKIAWAAYYAKQRALEERKGELYLYEFDAGSARQAANRTKEAYEKALADANIAAGVDIELIDWNQIDGGLETVQKILELEREWATAEDKAAKAEEEFTKQSEAMAEAEKQVADGKQFLIEKYGEEEEAAKEAGEETDNYLGKTAEEWGTVTAATNEAVKALADYVQGVRDATAQAVNSSISGFNYMKTAAEQYEEQTNKVEELRNELKELHKDWKPDQIEAEIKIQIDDANAQETLQGMNEALQSQLNFIQEYQDNLKKARELGVSDEVLASLADGSNDSAMKLHAITEAYKDWTSADIPTDIQELNRLFDEVGNKKSEFTDTLTQQKLTVDETYKAMVETAKQSISEMNMSGAAAEASGQTVEGIASGISSHVSSVSSAVDAILSELNRLSGWGINIDLGSFGSFSFSGSGTWTTRTGSVGGGSTTDGSYETGLNWVPFDGFLASLHEGEGILTAEENRIWQRFKNGSMGTGMDYDALGGVMRDSIKPGGDVYMDGRVVGQVISEIQGSQYRSMKRSGWQQ